MVEQPYDLKKKGQKIYSTKGCEGEDQKGLPDGMSCAGIFGSCGTKTVVMAHHRVNGSGSHLSMAHLKPTHKAYRNSVSDVNQMWLGER